MLIKPWIAIPCALLVLGGCAEFETWRSGLNPPVAAEVTDASGSPLYIAAVTPADVAVYRNIYIAPANLANMQVIQPEGTRTDPEWWVTDEEDTILQRTITHEFTVALSYQLDFNIVHSPQEAQLVVNTAVVAVHPNEARASIAKDANPSGSITVSIAVVNAASGAVLLRSVDTRVSEDIWAFNEIGGEHPALNEVFVSWGAELRRGLLELQGRTDDALVSPTVSSAHH